MDQQGEPSQTAPATAAPIRRGILRHEQSASMTSGMNASSSSSMDSVESSTSTAAKQSRSLRWDEQNIHETGLERGTRMKIIEPKTPYIHYDHAADNVTHTSNNAYFEEGRPTGDSTEGGTYASVDSATRATTTTAVIGGTTPRGFGSQPGLAGGLVALQMPASAMVVTAAGRGQDNGGLAVLTAALEQHVAGQQEAPLQVNEWDTSSEDDDAEEQVLDEKAQREKEQFAKKRNAHYHMGEALKRARQLQSEEEDEDESESDDD